MLSEANLRHQSLNFSLAVKEVKTVILICAWFYNDEKNSFNFVKLTNSPNLDYENIYFQLDLLD